MAPKSKSTKASRLMRVFVRPQSVAETKRNPSAHKVRAGHAALAPGFHKTPDHDLKFRGGRTIAQLSYVNFYVGGPTFWNQSDVDHIDLALARAMADKKLNNVMRQYFANQMITTTFLASHFVGTKRPKLVTQRSAQTLVKNLFHGGQLSGIDFPSTVVNLLLPQGTLLTDGTGPGKEDDGKRGAPVKKKKAGAPEKEEASSLEGLGGYHGAVDVSGKRIYYAVGVYSERLANGQENGIAVFDQPWKNIVGTFYHELQEARTDPDVDEAIRTGKINGVIGWNSDEGEECGDFPVFEAGDEANLGLAFRELSLDGVQTPVQLQYSNAVHGPEGPIASPHALVITHQMV